MTKLTREERRLTREERRAIHEARVEAKRARATLPTAYDMLNRKSAVARSYSFQNLNFSISTIQTLLFCDVDEAERLELKTLALTALQKARRNGESAKFTGCALYHF